MKPSFALNFTDDSIGLLHRTARGWLEIGAVGFDEADLAQAIAYLRGSALGLEPRGITTKLVIPNSQIRYMTLPAPGPDAASRRAQIKAALEGKTPYAVDDLVFDWSGTGSAVQVAVVARETLDEAEAFARDNRLNPLSFVAIPEAGSFAGEPWFGPSSVAASLLAPGEKVERDQDPVRVVGRAPRPEPAPPTAEAAAETDAQPDPPMPSAPEPVAPAPEDSAPKAEVATVAAPKADAPTDTPADAPIEAPAKPAKPEPATTAAPETAKTVPPRAEPDAIFARSAAAAGPGSRVTDSTIASDPAPAPAEASPAPAATPPSPRDLRAPPPPVGAAVAGKSARAPAAKAPIKAPDPRKTGPRLAAVPGGGPAASGTARVTIPEAEWPLERVTAGARAGTAETARSAPVVTAPGIPLPRSRKLSVVPAATPDAPPDAATAATRSEAETMTVFGARKQRQPGKPRYLLLILVGVLLVVLAATALWSTYLAQRNDAEPTAVAAAPDTQATAEAEPVATPAPVIQPAAPTEATDPETAAVAPQDVAAPPPADTAAETETETATAPTPPVAAEPPAPEPEPAPLDSASVASAGAEPAGTPGNDPQDEIFLSLADRPIATTDAVALTQPLASNDSPPQPQTLPPPFGTLYQFDDRGLIVPTAEGIVTPEGVRLVAGKPPLVPPARPAALAAADTVAADPVTPGAEAAAITAPEAVTPTPTDPAGETVAEIAAEVPAVPEEAAPIASDPALAGARPRSRPADLVPPAPADDDAAIVVADDTRVTSLKPRARPAALLAEGEAALAARTAEASAAEQAAQASLVAASQQDASASSLAVAVSRKPAPRPATLDRSIEAAVQLAAADASLAAPSAPLLQPPEPASAPEPAPAPAVLKQPEPEPTRQAEPERDPDAPGESAFTQHSDDPAVVEQDEPESGGSAPATSARSIVAKQATLANALNMSKTSLIGIYGSSSNRYAMVRQPGGRFVKVGVGDRIDGGRVAAISDRELSYVKNGQTVTLKMPRG